jgi:hypothetical protein
MAFRRALCLPLLCACAAAQPASIRGRTYDSTTGKPLSRVHIRLAVPSRDQGYSAAWGAMSDDEGRFSIASIPPGTYLVQGLRPGYFYLPKGTSSLTLKTGEHLDDFRMDLAPHL